MKILQFIHLNQIKAKKFLWIQGSKPRISNKIEILLLVLFLVISDFNILVDTPAASASEKQEKPVKNAILKNTYNELITNTKDEQEVNDNENNEPDIKTPENNESSDNEPDIDNPEDENPDIEEPGGNKPGIEEPEDKNTDIEEPEDKENEKTKNENQENSDIKGKWKTRNNKIFYYENGKKVKGLKKIGTKYYFFDSKGVQHTGWQKYKKNYYFFKISNEKKGFMTKSEKVNGIILGKNGKAKLTVKSKAKLEVLVKANKIVEKATNPKMKRSEKLKKTFKYLIKYYKYRGSPIFIHTSHWELDYALQMFNKKHGSCYAYGAAFAFLANAVGYNNCYAISSGGHGWAEVNGKVYDPSWCLTDRNHSYYALNYNLSGAGGRPNYKIARKYVIKI